jgi:hypothetical protein
MPDDDVIANVGVVGFAISWTSQNVTASCERR